MVTWGYCEQLSFRGGVPKLQSPNKNSQRGEAPWGTSPPGRPHLDLLGQAAWGYHRGVLTRSLPIFHS